MTECGNHKPSSYIEENTKSYLEVRPPVIGKEHSPSVSEYAPTDDPYHNPKVLMHSFPDQSGKPPTLPPKPRIGSGAAVQRGPPPPVLPRSSSLLSNPTGDNFFADSGSEQSTSNQEVPGIQLSGAGSIPNLPQTCFEEAVMVGSTNKCDNRSGCEENLSSPQPTKSAGSENSRGFEPEGSVDMSPSYSESGGSGGVGTNNGTPPYIKWREGISFLLEDEEGTKLFTEYLSEQKLEHYVTFILMCRGFKKDCNPENIERIIKALYRKYVNPTRKNLQFRIPCIDPETRNSIDIKLSNQTGLDQNIFDGAVESVLAHLSNKFYPNFLTSEIFVSYVRHAEADLRLSAASSVSGSRNQRDLQVDSGMEEDKAYSSSKSSTVPILTMSDSVATGPPERVLSSLSSDPLRLSSASSTTCNSSVFNSTQFLPTLDEDKELKLNPPTATPAKGGHDGAQLPFVNPPQGINSSKMAQLNTSYPPPAMSSRSRLGPNEVHPSVFPASSGAVPDITSASYAYHANSSTWNPVSRQDSELQSQSSGAVGGDTTDDNYSTFTDVQQQQIQQYAAKKHREKKMERRQQQKEFQKIEKSAQLTREDPNQFLPRPNFDKVVGKGLPNQPNPSKDIEAFANLLTSKLATVKKSLEGNVKLNQKLSQLGDGDSSVASAGPPTAEQKKRYQYAVFASRSRGDPMDAESDQSILDDHVSRMFTGADTPEFARYQSKANVTANTTSAFDTTRRSMNASMSGHSTLPGRSRSAAFNQYGHQMSSSMSQQSHHGHYRSAAQYSSTSLTGELSSSRSNPGVPVTASQIEMNVGSSSSQHQVPMPPYSGQNVHSHKVNSWLKNVPVGHAPQYSQMTNTHLAPGAGQLPDQSISKISPRSSGRYHTSGRAKSQDRSSGYTSGLYNMAQQGFSGQYPGLDPNTLTSRLHQQQQEQIIQQQQQHLNRSTNMRGVMPPAQSTGGASGGASGVHPGANPPLAPTEPRVETAVVYRFPQEKDEFPYRVKIGRKNLTLLDIKNAMPKKGHNFRFYFKTKVDGEACFEQETNENAIVPMWEGSVIVQCRND